ncbi:hypothetical protein LXL04_002834 [Taraxacum kok-saghyz]
MVRTRYITHIPKIRQSVGPNCGPSKKDFDPPLWRSTNSATHVRAKPNDDKVMAVSVGDFKNQEEKNGESGGEGEKTKDPYQTGVTHTGIEGKRRLQQQNDIA